MIKKITVAQLKPGVFVHDFNTGWLHHPFLKNQVKIKTDQDIDKLVHYQIHDVYIDTDRGLDVEEAPTQEEVAAELQTEIDNLSASAVPASPDGPRKEDLIQAQRLLSEAKRTTRRLMDDVKLGKQLDLHQVETLVERLTESVLSSKDALISLARIKNKDEYTYMHALAVSALCISFGAHLGLDSQQIKHLGIGGLVHDIGKVKVPLEILNKPGALTEQEFEVIKQHVHHGTCILQQTTIDDRAVCVTAHHHERLDGSGYPAGLQGAQISVFGQMAAVIDIYDALTSERCYKASMPPTQALRKLFEWSASYLKKELVEQFIAHVGIYPLGTLVRLRSGFLGVVVSHGEKGLLYPVVRAVYDTRKAARIEPFTLDLSKKASTGTADEITGCESPDRWQLRPETYLAQ
jgi:HD-GYP domain-containing protein (c-di-GMP phosphodiesterase class II)